MADFPQHEIHFPGDAIAAAATAYAPWNVAPAHPQPEPLYYRVPVPGQPHGYAGVLVPDGMFPPANAAGNRQPEDGQENYPPLVNFAEQGQPQGPQYLGTADPYRANEHLTLHEHRTDVSNNYAGVTLDFPPWSQATVSAPEPEGVSNWNSAQNSVAHAGHVQPFTGVPNGSAAESLWDLATLYLCGPDPQVEMINIGPGHSRRVRKVVLLAD